jgi:hypothetical protein
LSELRKGGRSLVPSIKRVYETTVFDPDNAMYARFVVVPRSAWADSPYSMVDDEDVLRSIGVEHVRKTRPATLIPRLALALQVADTLAEASAGDPGESRPTEWPGFDPPSDARVGDRYMDFAAHLAYEPLLPVESSQPKPQSHLHREVRGPPGDHIQSVDWKPARRRHDHYISQGGLRCNSLITSTSS